MRSMKLAMTLATLVLVAACSGGYGGTTGLGNNGGSTSNAIGVNDNSFSPATTTVTPGTTVTWTWNGAHQHNVTFDDGPASATQTSGTYARAFSAAGSYKYHCTIHGTAMSGTVRVQ